MPRQARKLGDSGVYHVVIRGINKQTVFYDENDGKVFLNRLKLFKPKLNFEVYAFCLMSNHAHLLIKEEVSAEDKITAKIGDVIHRLLTSYVYWYNKKYERVGHLFQNRFSSEPIDDDAHLLACVRYIHQNPLKSNLLKNLADYEWSSYTAYLTDEANFVDIDFVLGVLGSRDEFIEFHNMQEPRKFIDVDSFEKLTDEKLVDAIKALFTIDNLYKLNSGDYIERDENIEKLLTIKGTTVTQLSRVTGISAYAINDYKRRHK